MPAFRGKLGCGERNVRGANGRETAVLKSSQSFDQKKTRFLSFFFLFHVGELDLKPRFLSLKKP